MRHPFAVEVALTGAIALAFAGPANALDPAKALSQYTVSVWRTENGLPQDSLTAIAQDTSGALWLGTPSGLVRFDGTRFTRVAAAQLSPADRYVTGLAATADGTLWISTRDALLERSADGGVRRHGTETGLPTGGAFGLVEADPRGSGALYLATTRGVFRFAGGSAEPIRGSRGESLDAESYAVARGAGGRLLAATARGLLVADRQGARIYGRADGLQADAVSAVLEDRFGHVWVGTTLGLARFTGERFEPVALGEQRPEIWVRTLAEDRDGNLWIGARGGGGFRFAGKRLEPLAGKVVLPNDLVRQIFEDRDGGLWWVTAGGLARLMDGAVTTWSESEGLPAGFLWSVAEAGSGELWIGTNGSGVARLGATGPAPAPFRDAGLAGVEIRALLTDRQGTLWIGTGNGLACVRGGRVSWIADTRSPTSRWISSLLEDRRGRLWAGTAEGLVRIEGDRIAATYPRLVDGAAVAVRSLAEEAGGTVLVGFASGIARFDGERLAEIDGAEALATARVHCILPEAHGESGGLWLATDGGLARLAGGRLERWTKLEGLPNDMLYWLIDDGAGNLWASSDVGILRLPKVQFGELRDRRRTRLEPLVLGRTDGMRATECNSGHPAGVRRHDGTFCFVTTDGLACADPRLLTTIAAPPPVAVTELLIDGEPSSASGATPVVLSSGSRRLEIRYAATALLAPDKLTFRYRLDGFDPGWVDAGASRVAQFTRLPAGSFRFAVAARRAGGEWSAPASSPPIEVRPAFHETAAFYLFALAIAALAGAAAYRLRTRQLRNRARQLSALVEERTRELEQANSELGLANSELERLSLADGLTRISNRRHFDHQLDVEWRRAARTEAPLSLLLADIDHFKPFNDAYGHLAGDECLRAVAAAIAGSVLRAEDLVARYGGEEIAVLLPGTVLADAALLAERLRRTVEALDRRHERSPEGRVTLSLGVASLVPEPHSRPEGLIAAADRALYRAKAAGRNRVES